MFRLIVKIDKKWQNNKSDFSVLYTDTHLVQTWTSICCIYQGITYDTGGADIKAGGIMAGMHRDKCGAAFVAGFFKVGGSAMLTK